MRLIDADHLKNKLGVWWDKQDEIFAEMIDECPTINLQEPKTDVLDKIKTEIAEYKDDKIIHEESNEMIDIVLEIIGKYKAESEEI